MKIDTHKQIRTITYKKTSFIIIHELEHTLHFYNGNICFKSTKLNGPLKLCKFKVFYSFFLILIKIGVHLRHWQTNSHFENVWVFFQILKSHFNKYLKSEIYFSHTSLKDIKV